MLTRITKICLALTVAAVATFSIDASDAEAQGLIRRLRSRIESRIVAPPAVPTPPRPRAGSAQQPTPATADPAQRLRPLAPAAPTASRNSAPNAPSDRKFGGSILAPPSDPKSTAPIQTGDTDRPTLGIEVLQSRSAVPGVRVVKIREESLADEAGLRLEDIIVAIDGKNTPTIADVAQQLKGKRMGQKLRADIIRDGRRKEVSIPLVGKRIAASKPNINIPTELPTPAVPGTDAVAQKSATTPLGIEVNDLTGQRGAVITKVLPNTPAAAARLKKGDRIVSVGGSLIANSVALLDKLERNDRDELTLRIVREGVLVDADVNLVASTAVSGEPTPATPKAAAPSALNGIGSAIGGLFGGGKPSQAKPKQAGSDKEGAVRQVGFDEEPEVVDPLQDEFSPRDRGLDDDPPSLDELELPAGKVEPIPSDSEEKTIEQLKDEIRRLKEALDEKVEGDK